jgi:hypothetical protein
VAHRSPFKRLALEAQKLEAGAAEQSITVIRRQIVERFDQLARNLLAERKWVVRTQRHAIDTYLLDQSTEGISIVYQRIDIELSQVASRIRHVGPRAQIWADMEPMLDPADDPGKGAPTMGEAEPKVR